MELTINTKAAESAVANFASSIKQHFSVLNKKSLPDLQKNIKMSHSVSKEQAKLVSFIEKHEAKMAPKTQGSQKDTLSHFANISSIFRGLTTLGKGVGDTFQLILSKVAELFQFVNKRNTELNQLTGRFGLTGRTEAQSVSQSFDTLRRSIVASKEEFAPLIELYGDLGYNVENTKSLILASLGAQEKFGNNALEGVKALASLREEFTAVNKSGDRILVGGGRRLRELIQGVSNSRFRDELMKSYDGLIKKSNLTLDEYNESLKKLESMKSALEGRVSDPWTQILNSWEDFKVGFADGLTAVKSSYEAVLGKDGSSAETFRKFGKSVAEFIPVFAEGVKTIFTELMPLIKKGFTMLVEVLESIQDSSLYQLFTGKGGSGTGIGIVPSKDMTGPLGLGNALNPNLLNLPNVLAKDKSKLPGATINAPINAPITIVQNPGESQEEFAKRIPEHLKIVTETIKKLATQGN